MLKVDDADAHRSHFYVREWQTGVTRPLRRYMQNFERIRKVQKYILTQAARQGVPVLDNASIDLTVKAVMAEVLDAVSVPTRRRCARRGTMTRGPTSDTALKPRRSVPIWQPSHRRCSAMTRVSTSGADETGPTSGRRHVRPP